MGIESIVFIAILIFSVIIHEVAHGYMAYWLGDMTAKYAGRLTLNPVPHIDPFGSVLLPALMVLSGSPILFGWAKPVPFNPYNLRDQKWGTLLVAIAGVGANFAVAFLLTLVLHLLNSLHIAASPAFMHVIVSVIVMNLVLGVFNLIPVPPLDGSKVLFSLLPYRYRHVQEALERNWIIGIIVVVLLAPSIVWPVVGFLIRVLGIPL